MSTEETVKNLAGHAPAIKVGGMRVSRPRTTSTDEKLSKDELAKQAEEFGTEVAEKPSTVLVSGAPVKHDQNFTPEAVKSFHDKPQPTHDKPHNIHAKPTAHVINQPRNQ